MADGPGAKPATALGLYGDHLPECVKLSDGSAPCTCGFNDALALESLEILSSDFTEEAAEALEFQIVNRPGFCKDNSRFIRKDNVIWVIAAFARRIRTRLGRRDD